MLPYPTPPKGGGLYVIWLSECDEPHYYGGRAVSFKRRWRTHLQRLQKCIHKNPRMQATFNKYGVFRPEVLTRLHQKDHPEAEQTWLDENVTNPRCVNISPYAIGGCGNHSEETKARMSEAAQKRWETNPQSHGDSTRKLISTQQKGRIWINNGTGSQRLFLGDAEPLLATGWVRGRLGASGRQRGLWIHLNGEQKRVAPEEVDAYLAQGWARGTLKKQRGLWVHRPGTTERKRVTPDDLDAYLSEGWVRGSGKTRKMAWVNREGVKKRIPVEEVDTYLDDGWSRGSGDKTVGSRLWAHRFTADGTLERKRVSKAELPALLESGWIRGTGSQG